MYFSRQKIQNNISMWITYLNEIRKTLNIVHSCLLKIPSCNFLDSDNVHAQLVSVIIINAFHGRTFGADGVSKNRSV